MSYSTWTSAAKVEVCLVNGEGEVRRVVPLEPTADGYWTGCDSRGEPGDLYQYRLDGGTLLPDPASRFQPHGVHGPSMVVDPTLHQWNDGGWSGRSLTDLVIYELHVGTFTAEGTFEAAMEKLEHVRDLGATAIELMPLADFPGARNWGYDGVALYAPARAYGDPENLRELVQAAHSYGLAVILDVVYNHLGPDGNYLGLYHQDYFNPRHKTPWGVGLNFEKREVRKFFLENPPYWQREFHIDGFRMDATHAIADTSQPHILAEMSEAVHANGGFVIAEDERKLPHLLKPREEGGYGLDVCWADDFHHIVHVISTHEGEGYYGAYRGDHDELARTVSGGWLWGPREDAADAPSFDPQCFVFCLSNHDQAGNRALGERLGHLTNSAQYRAASTLLCLTPQIPLLFMGQEWNASTPFQYFTDHERKLGEKITDGRRQEFQHFAAFSDPKMRDKIPDPQAEATFLRSKLHWTEPAEPQHAAILLLYKECLKLRRAHILPDKRTHFTSRLLPNGPVAVIFENEAADLCVVASLIDRGEEAVPFDLRGVGRGQWQRILSSNESRFGGPGENDCRGPRAEVFFAG